MSSRRRHFRLIATTFFVLGLVGPVLTAQTAVAAGPAVVGIDQQVGVAGSSPSSSPPWPGARDGRSKRVIVEVGDDHAAAREQGEEGESRSFHATLTRIDPARRIPWPIPISRGGLYSVSQFVCGP